MRIYWICAHKPKSNVFLRICEVKIWKFWDFTSISRKIEFLREIDVKSRNLLHKFLGILLISAYGRKSNVLSLIRWKVPRFYMKFSAYGRKSKLLSWIRWKVPRFYRWSCMHNKFLNEWWFNCSKKSLNVPFP